MKATNIPFTTAPISVFVLADVNGVIRLRQSLPVNIPSSGSAAAAQATADSALANAATAQGTANTAQGTAATAASDAAAALAAANAAQSTANVSLPLAGGTMSGAIAMGNFKVTGLGAPSAAGDAARKTDSDAALAAGVAAQATADAATSTHSTLTYAATTNIDFALADYRSLALTGNVTFTTSNLAAPRTVTIKILADASIRTFTFPAGWIFVGAAAPADIAANKTAILTVTAFGVADANVVAAYAVSP